MASNSMRLVARLLWLFPALLLFLTVNQAQVARELRQTYRDGTPARAEVLELEISNRVDVTYDYVSLSVGLPDGRTLVLERLSLPHSLAPRLLGSDTLDVHVREGASQEVVIDAFMPTHWHIAAGQAGISFVALLLFAAGIFAWNRYLAREGDPARRNVE